MMRTTLNLDDDVAAPLAAMARQAHRSLSRVANDLLRRGLAQANQPVGLTPYEPATFDTGRPLVDVTDIAEAIEIIERA